jgi:hypothetical protein
MFTVNQCGSGMPGTACVGCQTGGSCDLDAGVCMGGSGGGGGGSDGGLPGICATSADCGAGCCDSIIPGLFGLCADVNTPCSFSSGTCNATTHACQ